MSQDTTREKLLDAAEALFADRGYDVVSVRDIAAAADANISAINYHFQGKEKCYQCVLERRLVPKRKRILEAFDRVAQDKTTELTLTRVVETFVRAHLEDALTNPSGEIGLRLIARELNEPRFGAETVFRELIIPIHKRFRELLIRVVPEIREDRILWTLISVVSQIINYVMRWRNVVQQSELPSEDLETLFVHMKLPLQVDQYMERVIAHVTLFSVGGITAICQEDGIEI